MAGANTNTTNVNLGPKVAAQTHELYKLFRPIWQKLADVREGTGGFLPDSGNKSYIWAHPREYLDHSITTTDPETNAKVTRLNDNPRNPSPKLRMRRKMAAYDNMAGEIIDAKKSALFREQPSRRVGEDAGQDKEPTELEDWWDDIDGRGTHIDDAVPAWWDQGGSLGHVALYFELPAAPVLAEGETQTAADQAYPYVCVYNPLDILDWRHNDDGKIVWVKLQEAYEEASDPNNPDSVTVTYQRVRIVDETSWKLYDYKTGKFISQGEHKLGRLPVVFLFGKRRPLLPDIGQSVLGDPQDYIDLFNLRSEDRELLRGGAFSFINVPLGSGPDAMTVESAMAMMGSQTGTGNVMFSGLPAQMLSADPSNVTSYHEEIARVERKIHRVTGTQWETDSKDAEATGSLELKREEMNTRLAGYADECQQAEYGLVELFYRWRYGVDGWEAKLEQDMVVVHYPERFSATPFDDVLNQIEAAQAVGMPAEFLKALRKSIVTKFEGMSNLTQKELKAIYDAIDNAPDDPTPAERMRMKMDIMTKAAAAGVKAPGEPKDVAA